LWQSLPAHGGGIQPPLDGATFQIYSVVPEARTYALLLLCLPCLGIAAHRR
jgi:hypothetical protein